MTTLVGARPGSGLILIVLLVVVVVLLVRRRRPPGPPRRRERFRRTAGARLCGGSAERKATRLSAEVRRDEAAPADASVLPAVVDVRDAALE